MVRQDLSRGVAAAMIAHAAGESSPGDLPHDTHAFVLSVPDEPALIREAARLEKAGVAFVPISEPDPPFNGALMALGLRPAKKEVLKRHLSSLPLLK